MPKACWKAPSLPLTRSRWKWWFREEKQPENGESQFASSRWTSHSGWGLLKQQNWTKLLPQPLKWKGPEFRGGEAICNVWHDQTTHSNLMCSICNWALLSFNLMTDHLPVWWLRTQGVWVIVHKSTRCLDGYSDLRKARQAPQLISSTSVCSWHIGSLV